MTKHNRRAYDNDPVLKEKDRKVQVAILKVIGFTFFIAAIIVGVKECM